MLLAPPRRLVLITVLVLLSVALYVRNPVTSARTKYYQYTGYKPIDADGDLPASGISNANQQRLSNTANDGGGRQAPSRSKKEHPPDEQARALIGSRPAAPTTTVAIIDPATFHDMTPIKSLEGEITPIKHLSHTEISYFVKNLTTWKPLHTAWHWPSWENYEKQDYDPNRWEGFDWELGYYVRNGVKRLEERRVPLKNYLPYPRYNTPQWQKRWKGSHAACQGPRGKDLDKSEDDLVKAYMALPSSFPSPAIGSQSTVGLTEYVCYDRNHRYGPYGYGHRGMRKTKSWTQPSSVKWDSVNWGKLQDDCVDRNKDRFVPAAQTRLELRPTRVQPSDIDGLGDTAASQSSGLPAYKSRTALLIRTWEGYDYSPNDLQAIRALVTELSLLSGGEYQVVLFVNVKQEDANIYDNDKVYQDVMKRAVPPELRDISVLWTEQVVKEWYKKVGDWQVYWHQFMPLQWFSKTHPQFDYVWNWETDARYTGNHYEFLERMADFAKAMPRKNLWERSSRFYIPALHGNFASFLADTDGAIRNATANGTMTPVWGPQPYNVTTQFPVGPTPPTSYDDDAFTWGVDEEADLITLQPMWDPVGTTWSYRYKIWNFIEGLVPHFSAEHPGDEDYYDPRFHNISRRVFINTVARFSKRQLHAMHLENRAGRAMQAEMWPATVALHHGLKAVYAHHPIWLDRKWPAWFLDATFNADNGTTARWAQGKDSPYNHDREAAFRGWSWYYSTTFPRTLYRRWLGWKAKDILGNVGGQRDFEDRAFKAPAKAVGLVGDEDGDEDDDEVGGWGRMCLPGMLLHPVKRVREEDRVDVFVARAFEEDRVVERALGEEIARAKEERGFTWS